MATPYREPADALGWLPCAVNPKALSLNESPFPPLPSVRSALGASIEAANRYPEYLPQRLRSLIAGHIGVTDEQVVIGAGATGVVMQILHAVTEPGDTMVMAAPTFDGYPVFAQIARLRAVTVPLDMRGQHDLDALADAARTARVVVLCRPHNPTGTVERAGAVEEFLGRIPPETLVVFDEAYVEFLPPEDRMDTGLVARHPNVLVLRSFSKAYGLAGLRIGYAYCAAELARRLWAMQLPFGVGITASVAVAASLAAEDELRHRIRLITDERRCLQLRLRSVGVSTTDSHANFVYLPRGGRAWREVFEHSGLLVRHYADGGVRITVGDRRSTRMVLAAVASAVR